MNGPNCQRIPTGALRHRRRRLRHYGIFFSGGTSTPHDYKGVAYDGQSAEACTFSFAYDLHHNRWETITQGTPDPRANSRGILDTRIGPVVVGEMVQNMAATARVTLLQKKQAFIKYDLSDAAASRYNPGDSFVSLSFPSQVARHGNDN